MAAECPRHDIGAQPAVLAFAAKIHAPYIAEGGPLAVLLAEFNLAMSSIT
jgi:hypothetical protein